MPRLVKLEDSSAVSNYTPASGNATIFLESSNGAIKLRAKNSSGDIVDIGGSDTSDATATASDIRSGYTAYTSTGKVTGTLVPSPFDLLKVTAYTPSTPSLTAISSIALSGMGMGEMDDYSGYNGTYNVTAATERESDPLARVFKHSTLNYYLYWLEYYGTGYWVLASSLNATELYDVALYYSSESALTSTTATWYSDMGDSQSVTSAVTNTTYAAVDFSLTCQKISSFSESSDIMTFTPSGTDVSYTSASETPVVNGLALGSGTQLLLQLKDTCTVGVNGLEFLASFTNATAELGSFTPSGTVSYGTDGGHASVSLTGQYISTSVTVSELSGDFTFACWVKPGNGDRFALFAAFDADQRIGIDTNGGTWNIWAGNDGWNILEADSGYSPDPTSSSGRGSISVTTGSWQHVCWTRSGNTWVLYIDGVVSLTRNRSGVIATGGVIAMNRWGNGQYISSNVRLSDLRIYNRGLSASEVAALIS